MRALLSTYGSRREVEPKTGLAVHLQTLGAEVQVPTAPRMPLTATRAPR
jgi:hypothetical protein